MPTPNSSVAKTGPLARIAAREEEERAAFVRASEAVIPSSEAMPKENVPATKSGGIVGKVIIGIFGFALVASQTSLLAYIPVIIMFSIYIFGFKLIFFTPSIGTNLWSRIIGRPLKEQKFTPDKVTRTGAIIFFAFHAAGLVTCFIIGFPIEVTVAFAIIMYFIFLNSNVKRSGLTPFAFYKTHSNALLGRKNLQVLTEPAAQPERPDQPNEAINKNEGIKPNRYGVVARDANGKIRIDHDPFTAIEQAKRKAQE